MASAFRRKNSKGRAARYTIQYRDQDGRVRQRAGYPDRTKSLELARRLETQARLVRDGMISVTDASASLAASLPVAGHVEDYRAYLTAKGGTAKHCHHTAGVIARLMRDAGISRLSELRPEKIQGALSRMRAARSARTCNHALSAVKGWTRYLAANGRLSEAPGWLAMLSRATGTSDHTRRRRVLTTGQLEALYASVSNGPDFEVRRGKRGELQRPGSLAFLKGEDRAWIYRIAAETGLRAGELRSLSPESFDLDGGTVTIGAAYAKNRRRDTLPLRSAILPALRAYLAAKPPGVPVWPMPEKCAPMLRRDLEAAGIPYRTKEGVADFHALRHAFISHLIERGVDPRTVQDLARHSTITLTIDRYGHSSDARRRKAIEGDDR